VQVSDGAAVALLMTRAEALRRGLPVLAVFRSFAAVGVDPAIMGVGPAAAIPVAVAKAGLTLDDIDVFEINEAFASQALWSVRHLGIDPAKVLPESPMCSREHKSLVVSRERPCRLIREQKPRWCERGRAYGWVAVRAWSQGRGRDGACVQVNPNGGAIALGHALGCTGVRMTATLIHEMQRRGRGARFGIVSMCIGSGMGAAAVYEIGDHVDPTSHTHTLGPKGFLSKDAAM
jgi:acetyl-CoA acetyltransferase